MPKLDLDAAKKRCEELKHIKLPYDCDLHVRLSGQIIGTDLPAALAECEWSREMLERVKDLFTSACPDEYGYGGPAWKIVQGVLRDLEKGPPDELARGGEGADGGRGPKPIPYDNW